MPQNPFRNYHITPITSADFIEVEKIEQRGQIVPWTEASLKSELADRNAFHFGLYATRDKNMLSFILSRLVLDELHIHHLCTHPDWRRRGCARALLEHCIETAKNSAGAQCAFLEVAVSNTAAVTLYEHMGFLKEFVRDKYYATGDDALVMSKKLKFP